MGRVDGLRAGITGQSGGATEDREMRVQPQKDTTSCPPQRLKNQPEKQKLTNAGEQVEGFQPTGAACATVERSSRYGGRSTAPEQGNHRTPT